MKKFIKLLLLITWMTIIYFFSSQPADDSLNESNSLLEAIAYVFNISDVDVFVARFGPFIRNLAHFGEFFLLGLIMYINVIEYTNRNVLLLTIIVCALYAASDEVHQLFVDGRVGTFSDVVIDSLGATCSTFLSYLIQKYVAKRKSPELRNTKFN